MLIVVVNLHASLPYPTATNFVFFLRDGANSKEMSIAVPCLFAKTVTLEKKTLLLYVLCWKTATVNGAYFCIKIMFHCDFSSINGKLLRFSHWIKNRKELDKTCPVQACW